MMGGFGSGGGGDLGFGASGGGGSAHAHAHDSASVQLQRYQQYLALKQQKEGQQGLTQELSRRHSSAAAALSVASMGMCWERFGRGVSTHACFRGEHGRAVSKARESHVG